jgi:hypothetical protein
METVEPLRVRRLPRPGRHPIERRRYRSEFTAEALELALASAQRRAKLDIVLVVDDQGMVVSQSRKDLDVTMLAAVTPIVGRGKARPRIRRDGARLEMSVRTIEIQGETLYIAAVGGELFARQRELYSSLNATKRILA